MTGHAPQGGAPEPSPPSGGGGGGGEGPSAAMAPPEGAPAQPAQDMLGRQ